MKGREALKKLKTPDKVKLQSIDEDRQEEMDLADVKSSTDIKSWRNKNPVPVRELKPPFQSDTTLVGSDHFRKEERSSFKSRIAQLLYKPKDEKKKKEDIRDKAPSLLGKLSSKFNQMNPFLNEQKSGSTEFKPLVEYSTTENRYINKSKKAFDIKYAVI